MFISPFFSFYLAKALLFSMLPMQKNVQESPLVHNVALKMAPKDYSKDYLMGKFQVASHPDFVALPAALTDGRQVYHLRKETVAAFTEMAAAARKDGVVLHVISATRNFQHQKQIWDAKWNGSTLVGGKNLAKTEPDAAKRALKILTYSSMPGTSRHHWGTDFDINSLSPAFFNKGAGKKTYEWLVAHAAEHGFAQPYTAGRNKGYNEEKWHWSYTPLSRTMTKNYAQMIGNQDITGFEGSASAVEIDMLNNYVLGVSEACK
jgi:zinc D-Ala-D-Ala carboxypeptidase